MNENPAAAGFSFNGSRIATDSQTCQADGGGGSVRAVQPPPHRSVAPKAHACWQVYSVFALLVNVATDPRSPRKHLAAILFLRDDLGLILYLIQI